MYDPCLSLKSDEIWPHDSEQSLRLRYCAARDPIGCANPLFKIECLAEHDVLPLVWGIADDGSGQLHRPLLLFCLRPTLCPSHAFCSLHTYINTPEFSASLFSSLHFRLPIFKWTTNLTMSQSLRLNYQNTYGLSFKRAAE
jgi:hypothetical protein